MRQLIQSTFRWIVEHFVTFVVIVAILVAGKFLLNEFRDSRELASTIPQMKDARRDVANNLNLLEKQVTERARELEKASLNTLDSRAKQVDQEILEKSLARRTFGPLPMLPSFLLGRDFAQQLILDAEILMLRHERDYLARLRSVITARLTREKGLEELEKRRVRHVEAYKSLKENEGAQALLRQAHPVATWIPGTQAYKDNKALQEIHTSLLGGNLEAYKTYEFQRKLLEVLVIPTVPAPFRIQKGQLDELLRPFHEQIRDLETRCSSNWLCQAGSVSDVLPTAFAVLLFIIVTPILVKFVFYFFLAPLASRRPPICLLPGTLGTVSGLTNRGFSGPDQTKASAVSLPLTIDESQEILIHPEYLQSSSLGGRKDTKWLMDWSVPFTSLASGMFALTRIRADGSESIVVSATRDPLSEVGIISLPEGSALALQPHNLIGAVYRKGTPPRITKHWRLGSLHAWLTLQLRYLVFHGAVQLLVKGCRGIRVEQAGTGRRINQAATIGFSANLDYSTMRCETFAAYLMGKQELLNDSFAGKPGFYIYEEMPHFGKRTGIAGRGLEGFTDSILKVFGI